VERRRSVAIAAGGLLAALAFFLLGRPSSDDLRAGVADLDALIRENAAGVQARADTLAQLPRLGWAVATDENTVRDLTTEELAFRPHPGEHIEISQVRRGGGEPRRLLRLPEDGDLQLPVLPGTHVVVRGNEAHIVTVVSVEPRQRADELVGLLAVAKQLDMSAIRQRLAGRGINAELRTTQGSLTLAGRAPSESSIEAKLPLASPAGQGAVIVAANIGRARWPRVVSPFILLLSLGAAGLLWRRGAAAPVRVTRAPPTVTAAARASARTPIRSVPLDDGSAENRSRTTPATGQPIDLAAPVAAAPASARTPIRSVPLDDGAAENRSQAAPATSQPVDPAAPVALPTRGRSLTGRVEITLARSAAVSLSARIAGSPGWPIDPNAQRDPRTEEYRALFAEFVKMRRTTGEPVEGLDRDHFVEILSATRARLMTQIPIKDVRFKIAFQNGKAAIRYQTVT
jgi:hypothetical protein